MATNRQYKSSVFSMLLEDKTRAMELYNALNDSHFTDADEVEIKRLDSGIYLTIHNDASFVFDSSLSVYEHQSTPCPNMPLRGLIYISELLHAEVRDQNLYGSSPVRIPYPKYVVFYNGKANYPEVQEMKLSDLYLTSEENPVLELKCKVYNINKGYNVHLLEKCKWLLDYMTFVDKVNEYHAGRGEESLTEDIDKALDYCVMHDVLKEFFSNNRSEIVEMTALDYSFERQIEMAAKDNYERGIEQGIEQGIERGIKTGIRQGATDAITGLIKDNKISMQEGAKRLNISEAELKKML